jgi:hypothetical protein
VPKVVRWLACLDVCIGKLFSNQTAIHMPRANRLHMLGWAASRDQSAPIPFLECRAVALGVVVDDPRCGVAHFVHQSIAELVWRGFCDAYVRQVTQCQCAFRDGM